MQRITPEQPTNWSLGLRALVGAMALAAISSRYGSPLPLYAAVPVGGWALMKPLRLGSWLLSSRSRRFASQAALRIAGLAVAAFALSLAIDSSLPVLQLAGTVLLLALLGVVAVATSRAAWTGIRRWTPRALSASGDALERLQIHAAWLRFAITGR